MEFNIASWTLQGASAAISIHFLAFSAKYLTILFTLHAKTLCWLWLAVTASIAVFAIHAKRGKAGFRNLLGRPVKGLVCSDRWSVYARVEVWKRQLCRAHLKRDFQKFKELGGEARKTGLAGLPAVKKTFEAWTEWKEKRIDRPELQERVVHVGMAL